MTHGVSGNKKNRGLAGGTYPGSGYEASTHMRHDGLATGDCRTRLELPRSAPSYR
jgi:hypothetical protein